MQVLDALKKGVPTNIDRSSLGSVQKECDLTAKWMQEGGKKGANRVQEHRREAGIEIVRSS
jgi:hypothetical protein